MEEVVEALVNEMSKQLVFVYGTLRRGDARSMTIRFPTSTFVADAKVNGSLYDFGAYPGLLLDDSTALVTGEVYEVDDETLTQLDEFEATSAYVRKAVAAVVPDGRKTCWIYVPKTDPDFSRYPMITSGDWLRYLRSKTD